ncbi:DNA methyltransferase [Novosphingobium sp. Gsoil 351]|uniref:site-specific DNA-methyltransferase n=1 Tax=Novosphingobium sp. Gsoil 351 TaxID=2675225 RepID=UPI001E352E07|nr:DNA methyltransferase [Novosphingobium sp. Gsoil 351]
MTPKKTNIRKRVQFANPVEGSTPTAALNNHFQSNLRINVTYRALAHVKPPARILRKHNKRQIAAIGASIREHGFVNPILINHAGQIVSGYGRWLAATALGMTVVPVIELEHLSPEQLRLYAIADNKIAEQSEFDLDVLRIELSELGELDLDLKIELSGFATSEIDDLLCAPQPEKDGLSGPPNESEVAITRLGDVWLLGTHRLICGNSLEAETYVTLMGGEKAGMVFSDSPYNESAAAISSKGKHKHRDFAMAAGEMSPEGFTTFLTRAFRHCAQHSIDGSIHFQCMNWKHMGEMLAAGNQAYTELKQLVVWAKPSASMGTFFRSQHELIFVWKNGTGPHINNFGLGETGRYRTNVWNYKGNAGFHRARDEELAAHPTVKPWIMVADAIRDCSRRGDIILDPFGGYGTTLIAAERTGRKARLIELDPLYCDATIRRWKALSGNEAVLEATGQTFAEITRERIPGAQDGDPVPLRADGDDGAAAGEEV